ncbi:DUF2231 domain-containing protein [Amycolatopsis sp. NPDC023774]|uniref:DUF2231 domain-containing protein n=1 Tax=Amycolatopsis sp. NPDC023774 TaxID=3155015 RepID=UPI0033EA002C
MTNTHKSCSEVEPAATPHRLLAAAERARALDGAAELVVKPLRRLFGGRAGRTLRGRAFGHPLRPPAVTGPIGAWLHSALLDAPPRNEAAARRLVDIGLRATPPTVVLGAADYSEMGDLSQRRVGLVHAATNAVAAGIFLTSNRLRLGGPAKAGTALSPVGLLALSCGRALDGHLSHAQGAGAFRRPSARTEAP